MDGDFDLAMRITGDASSAVDAAGKASSAADSLTSAQAKAITAATKLSDAQAALSTTAGKVSTAQAEAAAQLMQTGIAAAQASLATEKARVAATNAGTAFEGAARSSGSYNAANIVLQSVIRKTSDQFAAGASASTIFGEHIESVAEILELFAAQRAGKAAAAAGTIGEGMAEAGAKTGIFSGFLEGAATFLTGGWGIALTVGIAALSPLVGKLFEGKTAAEEAKDALSHLAEYQKILADSIDKTNGKLSEQNRLQAIAAGQNAPSSVRAGVSTIKGDRNQAFADVRSLAADSGRSAIAAQLRSALYAAGAGGNTSDAGNLGTLNEQIQKLAETSSDPRIRKLAGTIGDIYDAATKTATGVHGLTAAQAANAAASSGQVILTKDVVDGQIQLATANDAGSKAAYRLSQAQGDLNKALGQPFSAAQQQAVANARNQVIAAQKAVDAIQSAPRTRNARKPADHSGDITTANNDAANFIAQYTDAPTFILAAQKAIEKLDADAKKLNDDKPKGFTDALSAVANAKDVIENNLDKPYKDFLRTQNDNLQVIKLQAAGQDDQATALQQIIALQTKQIPLDDAHVQGVLDSVTALHKQQDAYALIQQRQSDLQSGLDAYRTTLEGIFTGQEKLSKLPGDLVSTFKQVSGKLAFDQLFGKSFQDLGNEIKGGTGLGGITDQFQTALASVKPPVADFSTDLGKAGSAASSFADTITAAANRISGSATSPAGSVTDATSALSPDDGTVAPPIVVDGKQPTASQTPVLTALGEIKAVFTSGLKAVGIAPESAKLIGNLTGTAIAGAAEGSTVGSLFGSLTGGKTSSVGSSIGGALGEVAGKELGKSVSGLASLFGDKALGSLGSALGPIGGALGGILGGVIGGLFKKVPTGGATITNSTGDASISGNSSSAESNASSLAGTVQSGLAQIAQQLGGTASAFSGITIGTYKDKFRVNTQSTKLGGSSSPVAGLSSYDSADEAVSAAIQDAVAEGAVKGLDAAVQKALSSSTDINKSLAEALQVENVEKLIGGIGYTLKQTFATFDATAAANFATAQTYSLDTVALEKQSADARTALVASTLKTAVGSLQDFITSETSGDDFEGSAADKRNAQLAQIAALQPKAQAGDQDSIDALASLYQNLLDTSKSAFGTAGTEYTSDRSLATTGAQGVIQSEQDRINTAAGISSDPATTAAVQAGNALASESNDLLAVNNTTLANMTAILATIAANSSSGNGGLSSTMRISSL